jgi:hypothetical protein
LFRRNKQHLLAWFFVLLIVFEFGILLGFPSRADPSERYPIPRTTDTVVPFFPQSALFFLLWAVVGISILIKPLKSLKIFNFKFQISFFFG